MKKQPMTLEERVEKLEREVEYLRKIIEAHIRDHGIPPPIHPSPSPKHPFKPDHSDIGPPREF